MALIDYKSDNNFTLDSAFSASLISKLTEAGYPKMELKFTNDNIKYITVPAPYSEIVSKLTIASTATDLTDLSEWTRELVGHMINNTQLLIRDTFNSYFYYTNYTLSSVVSATSATYATDITVDSTDVSLDVENECSVTTGSTDQTLTLTSANVTTGSGQITDYSDINNVLFDAGSDPETVVLTFVAEDSNGFESDPFTLTLNVVAS